MSPLLLARRRNPREDSGYGACPCPGAHCTFARLPNTPTNTPKLQKFASVPLLAFIRARITSTNVDARSWAHLKSCPCPWRSGPEPGTCSSAGGICSHLPGEWEIGEEKAQSELWQHHESVPTSPRRSRAQPHPHPLALEEIWGHGVPAAEPPRCCSGEFCPPLGDSQSKMQEMVGLLTPKLRVDTDLPSSLRSSVTPPCKTKQWETGWETVGYWLYWDP